MRRREFIAFAGAGMALPVAAGAQQKAMPVIGFLSSGSPGRDDRLFTAIRKGLAEAGFTEGQNVAIEYRWAEGDVNQFPSMAADIVARKVDVIVVLGGLPGARAVKNAMSTIPGAMCRSW